MAIDSTIHCQGCGQSKVVTHSAGSYPDFCDECKAKKRNEELQKFLKTRTRLPLEMRVRLLEEAEFEEQHRPEPWDGRIG